MGLLDVDRELNICRGICSSTALGTPFCVGCGRLEADVISWNTYSDEVKRTLAKEAKQRLQHGTSSTNSSRQDSSPIDSK